MAQRERSADSALRLLHALDDYTLAIERRAPSGYRRSSKWPIDENVIRQLDVAVRSEGAALASSDLRFMAHQTVEVGRLYGHHRNLDDWEWGPLEEAQVLALAYLHHALGRHVRGLEVRAWDMIPYHDLELLMAWRAPDMEPGQGPNPQCALRDDAETGQWNRGAKLL